MFEVNKFRLEVIYMKAERKKQVTYRGVVFVVKNTFPNIRDSERSLLIQTISDDLRKALNRIG